VPTGQTGRSTGTRRIHLLQKSRGRGARPLKRVLQRRIQDPLVLKILKGELRDGDHVILDEVNGKLAFTVVEPAAEEIAEA